MCDSDRLKNRLPSRVRVFLARMTGNITISLIVAAAFVPLSVRDIIQGKTTVLKDLSCLAITTQNYHLLTF